MFARLRHMAGADEPGELTGSAEWLTCIWCFSVAAAALLYFVRARFILYTLAASTVAIALDEQTKRPSR